MILMQIVPNFNYGDGRAGKNLSFFRKSFSLLGFKVF